MNCGDKQMAQTPKGDGAISFTLSLVLRYYTKIKTQSQAAIELLIKP